MFSKTIKLLLILSTLTSVPLSAQANNNVSGLYNAILYHKESQFYQYAKITLRTVNSDGNLKISANVRVFFGESESNEYLTYDFDNVPLNLLTRQISLENENNDLSMVGFLVDGKISGDWFSTVVGYVGKFESQKSKYPEIEENSSQVTSLSGHYKGSIKNENSESSLPERVSFSFVTTQENNNGEPTLHITGNSRYYLGDFGSQEYVEIVFNDIQFNFYNRFLTAKTERYGLTFKGYMSQDGVFDGEVYSDAVGRVGPVHLEKVVPEFKID